MIWKQNATLEGINNINQEIMPGYLGITFTAIGEDYLEATMPIDHRTKQPVGILHGGASVVLAETLGSVASVLCIDDMSKETSVGVEINANHLRPGTGSFVTGKVMPVRIGRKIHVWNIEIRNEAEKLICVSRITIAIVPMPKF